VDPAAAVFAQKAAAAPVFFHPQVGDGQALLGVQGDPSIQQIFKCAVQIFTEHGYIIRVQMDGIPHAPAAVAAAFTGDTGELCHVSCGH
jgi:hypothetical protein